MSNQYFENNDKLASSPIEITHCYLSHTLRLTTDLGVFSKKAVDEGTRVLLKNIPTNYSEKCILDVGCGYGTIGLSVAINNKNAQITMIDVNQRAIQLAKLNAKNNDITNVTIFESDRYENIKNLFDVIITNPPIRAGRDVVFDILEGAYTHLNTEGILYFVMRKNHGLDTTIKKLRERYSNVLIIAKELGYCVVKATKK